MAFCDFVIKYNPDVDTLEDLTKKILFSIIIKRLKAHKPVVIFLGGDSVTGDSRLFFKENGIIKFGTVKEAINSFNNSNIIEVQSIKGKDIRSNIIWSKVNGAYSHGIKQLYEVTFTNGKRIKITKDHSLFTLQGQNKLTEATIKESKRFITVEEINRPEIDTKYTEDDLFFFGIWLGDGWYEANKIVSIATGNNISMIEFLVQYLKKKGLKLRWKRKGDRRIYSTSMVKEMKGLGFLPGSKNKRVPKWIFLLPKKKIAAFLKGYLMADGSIHTAGSVTWKEKKFEKISIDYSSVSRSLLEQIQILLNIFSIQSCLSEPYFSSGYYSKNGQYKLSIQKIQSQKKFINLIGIPKGKENIKVLRILKKYKGINDRRLSLRSVRKINKINKEEVFDFEVNGSNSFIANGILLHNSGEGKSLTSLRFQELLLGLQGLELKDYLEDINVFTPLEYPQKLDNLLFNKDLKKINIICMHEAREIVKAKLWYTFLNQSIGDINAMSRSIKRLCIIVISQFIRDISSDIRYTLNYYMIVRRPKGKPARVYINVLWKDDRDLEKPKLRKRKLSGYLVYPDGVYRRFVPEYLELRKPDKAIVERFEFLDKESKTALIRKKTDKLIKEMQADIGQENIKVDSMVKWYLEHQENLTIIGKKQKGKWIVKKQFKDMHDLSQGETHDFEVKLNKAMREKGILPEGEKLGITMEIKKTETEEETK